MSGPAPDGRPEAASEPRVLRAAGLTKTYGRRVVVREVALEIRQGEVVGLLGPNGAGKTTTFYMVVGLARPDSGEVRLGDEDITAMPMYQRARAGIGYLPQEPSVFRKLTVEENVLAILETRGLGRGRAARAGARAARGVRDPGHGAPARLHALGRRAAAGRDRRALAAEPSFILLDEPFAGIDPIAVIDIQKIIAHLRERGIGVLITDHNVRETLKITDRAYILRDGNSSVPARRTSSHRTPRCAACTSARGSVSTDARPEPPAASGA